MKQNKLPWEDRAEVANERKRIKYDELRGECEERGYKVYSLPIEIGCRGFVCKSVWTMCKVVGLQRTDEHDESKEHDEHKEHDESNV